MAEIKEAETKDQVVDVLKEAAAIDNQLDGPDVIIPEDMQDVAEVIIEDQKVENDLDGDLLQAVGESEELNQDMQGV